MLVAAIIPTVAGMPEDDAKPPRGPVSTASHRPPADEPGEGHRDAPSEPAALVEPTDAVKPDGKSNAPGEATESAIDQQVAEGPAKNNHGGSPESEEPVEHADPAPPAQIDADAGSEGSGAAIGQESAFAEASMAYWAQLDEEQRETWYTGTNIYYRALLAEILANANSAVGTFDRFGQRYASWRILLLILTGTLALINVLATSWPEEWQLIGLGTLKTRALFSFIAALFAVVLALLTNIESFLNYGEKRFSSRETRELYLDAFREFEMLWMVHVYPFGYSAQACYNFSRLYRQLVTKDQELRRKIRQQSETRPTVATSMSST